MCRRVKEYVEISDFTPLNRLIDTLRTVCRNLPEQSEPQLKIKGDDFFGYRLSISYLRELNAEEIELDQRYSAVGHGHCYIQRSPSPAKPSRARKRAAPN